MRNIKHLAAVGVAVAALAACSAESDEPAPPAEPATSADQDAADTSEATRGGPSDSSESTGDSVPRVIESDLEAESLDALVRLAGDAGLDCSESSTAGEATSHDARLCGGNVLFSYFTDVEAMDGYVTGYVERGNHVVLGDTWFVTGRPAVINPLIATLQGK